MKSVHALAGHSLLLPLTFFAALSLEVPPEGGNVSWIVVAFASAIASICFCIPVFADYFANKIHGWGVFSIMFGNIPLSLINLAVIHSTFGVAPPCTPFEILNGTIVEVTCGVSNYFSDGIYFSLVTFTTLGYGDFQPVGYAGRYVAAIQALSGYLILGLTVGAAIHWGDAISRRDNQPT